MRIVDVIAKKRDGHALSREEIDFFVSGVTSDTVPDYQSSALLMAIVISGMTHEETAWLTDAMARSGERVDLSDIPGIKVGKHSTGGVGDKVSIVVAPVAASCGVVVPKMSGRGLGHTGGTLDKLESIPGYRIDLSIDEFKHVLRDVGTSIIGQTASLAPADKKLYALRDVTATVEAIPLLASSIMSKKLAEGSDALVLDVKSGDGAFMKTVEGSRALAEAMVAIGNHAGVRTEAFITDMEAPLGRAVGNANEIIESVETLKGSGPPALADLVARLASRMVVLGGVESDAAAATRSVREAMSSGAALRTFARMIEAQGGDPRVVDDASRLPHVAEHHVVTAARGGYLTRLDAELVGRASVALGAGRDRVEDPVDFAVGIMIEAKPGDGVRAGDAVLELHYRDRTRLDTALALATRAVTIGDERPPAARLIVGEVRG